MQIATWNVNSLNVRQEHVLAWLENNPVDVLALQETKLTDDRFPSAAFAEAGYYSVFTGQKTYNGVALLSRDAPTDVEFALPGLVDEHKRVIAATVAGVRVIGVYCPNGAALDSPKFDYKLDWFAALAEWVLGSRASTVTLAPASAVLRSLQSPRQPPSAPGPAPSARPGRGPGVPGLQLSGTDRHQVDGNQGVVFEF